MKRSTRIMLIASLAVATLLVAFMLVLQQSDSSTINVAKQVDAFIVRYCKATSKVPSLAALSARFPQLRALKEWRFFTDARTYLRMQYPVKWWNTNAIGVRILSKVTATPTAYVVEYRCGKPATQKSPEAWLAPTLPEWLAIGSFSAAQRSPVPSSAAAIASTLRVG